MSRSFNNLEKNWEKRNSIDSLNNSEKRDYLRGGKKRIRTRYYLRRQLYQLTVNDHRYLKKAISQLMEYDCRIKSVGQIPEAYIRFTYTGTDCSIFQQIINYKDCFRVCIS